MLSSGHSDGSFTKTQCQHQQQQPFSAELSLGETIHLGNQEFIADRSDNLSLSPQGKDLGVGNHGCGSQRVAITAYHYRKVYRWHAC
jgi:hypothetical protein